MKLLGRLRELTRLCFPELTLLREADEGGRGLGAIVGLGRELHAPDASRISDAEMKQLMIRFSTKVAWLLHLRDAKPDEYARQIDFFRRYTRNWDRHATGRDVEQQ